MSAHMPDVRMDGKTSFPIYAAVFLAYRVKSVRPDAVRIMRTTRAERGCLQATSTLRASAHQRLFLFDRK